MIIQNSKILHLAQDTWLTAEELRALNPMQYLEFTMKQKVKRDNSNAAKGIKDACDMKNSKNWCTINNNFREFLVNSYLNNYYFDYILVDKANIVRDRKIMVLLSLSIADHGIEWLISRTIKIKITNTSNKESRSRKNDYSNCGRTTWSKLAYTRKLYSITQQ